MVSDYPPPHDSSAPAAEPEPSAAQTIAAVDLGSNSFQLLVASVDQGHLKVLDRLREQVRLAGGLDETRNITAEAEQRALSCLQRFGQRLRQLGPGAVRAVGTSALREARNVREFIDRAEQVLGHAIEVVSGYEEARLIYQGVAHSVAGHGQRRLVLDIGGGSTELIVGEGFEPRLVVSLPVGCVNITRDWLDGAPLSPKRWRAAVLAAELELQPVQRRLLTVGWVRAVGSSGTVQAVQRVLREAGWGEFDIGLDGLEKLEKALLEAGGLPTLPGLSAERAPVFAGGVAVLVALMRALRIERLEVSEGAMREGIIYDLLGRMSDDDVRDVSVRDLAERYHVDSAQVERVAGSASGLLAQVSTAWELGGAGSEQMLQWAARLHEIGLDISHSRYHKHGAYIIRHADLAGFSRQEQCLLAALVRTHRRRFRRKHFRDLPERMQLPAMRLAILLRLAVLLRRGRDDEPVPRLRVRAEGLSIRLHLPSGWHMQYPLLAADLAQETFYLQTAGFQLSINQDGV